jgi:AraC family transcriptional regulator
MIIHIKNMVCDRCVMAVSELFHQLGLHPTSVHLGQVEVDDSDWSDDRLEQIDAELAKLGFERIDDRRSRIIEQIKQVVIETMRTDMSRMSQKWSELISDKLHYDYTYLSGLFSSVEGITLEQYIIRQKVERTKELLVYDELSMSEIAWQLGYSSTAHLSNQFKKVTGLPPSHFRSLGADRRKPIDKV